MTEVIKGKPHRVIIERPGEATEVLKRPSKTQAKRIAAVLRDTEPSTTKVRIEPTK